MEFETHVYRQNAGLKSFSASMTGTFTGSEQEKNVVKLPFRVQEINNIMWCVNAVGYIELFWNTPETDKKNKNIKICVLSGNGRWDLTRQNLSFMKPMDSDGELLISTSGFDDLDSYTIIISGTYANEQ